MIHVYPAVLFLCFQNATSYQYMYHHQERAWQVISVIRSSMIEASCFGGQLLLLSPLWYLYYGISIVVSLWYVVSIAMHVFVG